MLILENATSFYGQFPKAQLQALNTTTSIAYSEEAIKMNCFFLFSSCFCKLQCISNI